MKVREHAEATFGILWYSAIVAAFLIAFTTVTLIVRPLWLGYERRAYKQSYQYVESKQNMLVQMAAEYDASEGQHKAALLERIKRESAMLQPQDVPPSVQRLLH